MTKRKLNEFDLLLELLNKDFKIDFNKRTHTLSKEIIEIISDSFEIDVSVKTFDRLINSIKKNEIHLVIEEGKAMQILCALVLKKHGVIQNISFQKEKKEIKYIYI